jgi:polyribonucleotide nucleotidyltransferase
VDSHGVEWKALAYGTGAEDGATDITLKARDEESLEKAQSIIADALAKAEEITHIGYMTFPDRSAFPRIIGNKGSVINDLSLESGTEIIVPKDDTTVKIYGEYRSD